MQQYRKDARNNVYRVCSFLKCSENSLKVKIVGQTRDVFLQAIMMRDNEDHSNHCM